MPSWFLVIGYFKWIMEPAKACLTGRQTGQILILPLHSYQPTTGHNLNPFFLQLIQK